MFSAMNGKQKISPDHTYVFDDSDIEQFDELSLSCVMEAVQEPGPEEGDSVTAPDAAAASEDTSKDEELTLEDD